MSASVGILEVKKAAKSLASLAAQLGITRGAVSQWARVPAERVIDVERITGVPRHVQRPDIYPVPFGRASFASSSGHAFSPSIPLYGDHAPPATPCHVNESVAGLPAEAGR